MNVQVQACIIHEIDNKMNAIFQKEAFQCCAAQHSSWRFIAQNEGIANGYPDESPTDEASSSSYITAPSPEHLCFS